MRDLKRSLKKSNNSYPGPIQIHYENLRHLSFETLHILLEIINEVWKSDTLPESWREALIISISNPERIILILLIIDLLLSQVAYVKL